MLFAKIFELEFFLLFVLGTREPKKVVFESDISACVWLCTEQQTKLGVQF